MKDNLLNTIGNLLEGLKDETYTNLTQSGGKTQPWPNENPDEIQEFIESTISVLKLAKENGELKKLPLNLIRNIHNQLNAFNQQYIAIKGLQPQQITNQHHSPLNQLLSLDSQLRTSGLFTLVKLSPDVEAKAILLDETISAAASTLSEADTLRDQVKNLLDPAVAGNLSNGFNARRRRVSWQKWFWFAMIISSAITIAWLTININELLATIFGGVTLNGENAGLLWILRLFLLLPAYTLVLFAISQFLRERRFEEFYAHKASIAQTLPTIGELVSSSEVKDQITSSATKIVFEPPYNESKSTQKVKGFVPGQLTEISDLLNSLNSTR